MQRIIVLGTDTDAGKTTFASLWLAAFLDAWSYWKPLETGPSDTEAILSWVPGAKAFPPVHHFDEPVAPPLAAVRAGRVIPPSHELASLVPAAPALLIETFGSPYSPLNETELQIEFIRRLSCPVVLVSSSKIGAVGRTLALVRALSAEGIVPRAIVLLGEADEFAATRIAAESAIRVFTLRPPTEWTASGIQESARFQLAILQEIQARLIESPPVDQNWLESDRRFVWHPYTPLQGADPPLPIVGAQDEFLHHADGSRLIDAISSWWTILHGHRDRELMAVLQEASRSFDHVLFAGATHPPAVAVAEKLLRSVGWLTGRVFFSENGSTAVEVALKMAYQFWRHRGEPGRTLFVGFENGYHGDTFGAMAVGRDPLFFGAFEPLLFQVERVPVSADRLDDILSRHANKVAAVILEPLLQAAGGMRLHSPEELRAIVEVVHRHGTLFIADEVMTGCHRTGTMWAYQAAGVEPDLIAVAKTLAGGILPLAATLASARIVDAFDTPDRERMFFHGHSFTAHPLACAVAAANLERLHQRPPDAPARFERFWEESFAPLRDHPRVREVRIRGTMAAIELNFEGGYLAGVARELRTFCLKRGVFARPLGNVLYTLPPYGTSDESLERIGRTLKDAICNVETG